MAVTAISIINRALRLVGVLDAAEAATGIDAQNALDTMNAMLAEWFRADVGLPEYQFAALTTVIATDAADREAIAYTLAARIAPEYGLQLSPEAMATGEVALQRMSLRYFQPGATDFSELPHRYVSFDITNG